MIKAFLVDFYGTLVFEDGEIVEKISEKIFETGKADSVTEIDSFWWKDFQKLFTESYGKDFETQRDLEKKSIENTVRKFHSSADVEQMSEWMFDYWVRPDIFGDTKAFFEQSPIPIYIVSNIDTSDVVKAIDYHGLKPMGVITSEDARSYKPRKEIFEMALKMAGLKKDEVVHIGDSISSDVKGAIEAGIRVFWLNRFGKSVPEGVESISSLLDAIDRI